MKTHIFKSILNIVIPSLFGVVINIVLRLSNVDEWNCSFWTGIAISIIHSIIDKFLCTSTPQN